uniref:Small ribosomal subunit protein eS6 n=1 Tax=Angiostrongylus cantonensis TaxID=6313 RepID=A0A0K0DLI3_ANGCA
MKFNFANPATIVRCCMKLMTRRSCIFSATNAWSRKLTLMVMENNRSCEFSNLFSRNILLFLFRRCCASTSIVFSCDLILGIRLVLCGGCDRKSFPMKRYVLTNGRVRILIAKGDSFYRSRKAGEGKRRPVRDAIYSYLEATNFYTILVSGGRNVESITDNVFPCGLRPKKAAKIRKLLKFPKEDNAKKYVTANEETRSKYGILFLVSFPNVIVYNFQHCPGEKVCEKNWMNYQQWLPQAFDSRVMPLHYMAFVL